MKLTSDELNERIEAICDGIDVGEDVQWPFEPVPNTGKCIWYWGWYWRRINFDLSLTLATSHDGESAGFCASNKWNYPMFTLTPAQSTGLREAIEVAVKRPSKDNLTTVWGLMQSAIPGGFTEQVSRQKVYA